MKEKIIKLYNSKVSTKNISIQLKITRYQVLKTLKEADIKLRNLSDSHKTLNYDETYFEKIDTEAKAYFLGLLYADGNVCIKGNRKRFQITLQDEDIPTLEKLLKEVGGGNLYKDRKYTKISIYNSKMVDDLIKLGCVPSKSLILKFPKNIIPDNLMNHFIRGFFDGDGSVVKIKDIGYTINFTSVESFLNPLKEILLNNGIKLSKFYIRYKNKLNSAGSMYFYQSKRKEKIFYNYLYKNATIYMDRKYLKMKNIC